MAAAQAWGLQDWSRWTRPVWRVSRRAATPVAAVLLLAVYGQALFGIIPFGRGDPLARLLAIGFDGVAQTIEKTANDNQAAAILTTDYASTSWFSFYLPGNRPIVQADEPYRYADAPVPDAALLSRPLLYVVEQRLDKHAELAANFSDVSEIARFDRLRHGVPIAHYVIYRVTGWRGRAIGRMP
jgi:hypothetical protein